MEKNGTNQLGITLGYDAKLSSTGNLFVCEVRTQIHTHTHTYSPLLHRHYQHYSHNNIKCPLLMVAGC